MNSPPDRLRRWTVIASLAVLLAIRLPSLAQPAGADQSLYIYAGQRLMDGAAPYAEAWDQKPPGIHLIYGLLYALWPDEAIVGIADLLAAAAVAGLLVVLGTRLSTPAAGRAAAILFLLLGHPSLHRLGGVFVRGQSETFIALAVTAACVLALSRTQRARALAAAGVLLGVAFWIKYNAAAYVLPIVVCLVLRRDRAASSALLRRGGILAAGALGVSVAMLAWIAATGALTDLRLATIEYNLAYSGETYRGPSAFLGYAAMLPLRHARYDLLWFLGGTGLLLAVAARQGTAIWFAATWLGAAVLSIAINSARDLPQYFVQAAPALAFAAGLGLTGAVQSRRPLLRAAAAGSLVLGLWRVGTDAPLAGGVRLGGLPGLAANIRFDLDYIRGRLPRDAYLARFGGQRPQDKFAAGEIEDLAGQVRQNTQLDDRILVFGFSPGVYVKSDRLSASRFFWSRPIVIGFASDQPDYGADALLDELRHASPAMVILQKQDWGPAEPNSEAFFLSTPQLAGWLQREYRLESTQRLYSVWRRQ
jgi:hypothetical protein